MVSKFRETLPILDGPAVDPDVRLGVCAMGPVAPGDTLTWMRVWVWQQVDSRVAASSGTSGTHLGSHPLSAMEHLPFTDPTGWMIQTELEPGSEQFMGGEPALANAMALVQHEDGTRDVEQWSQAVTIAGNGAGHDRDHDND